MRLRPSRPTARSLRRSSDRALRSSRSGEISRIGAGHLAERVVVQGEVAAFQQRPRDVVRRQPARKTLGLERAPLVDTIVGVDLGDQLVLNIGPTLAELRQACPRRSACRRAPLPRRRPCSARATAPAADRSAAPWPAAAAPARQRRFRNSRGSPQANSCPRHVLLPMASCISRFSVAPMLSSPK